MQQRMNARVTLTSLVLTAALSLPAAAGQVEDALSFQARLTDDSGAPLTGQHTLQLQRDGGPRASPGR